MILTHLVLFNFFHGASSGSTPPPTPTPEHHGGKGDNRRRARSRFPAIKPLGLPPAARARIAPTVQPQPAIPETPAPQALREAEIHAPAIVEVPPIADMDASEIDAEIGYWLKLKLQKEEDDLRIILLMAGSVV